MATDEKNVDNISADELERGTGIRFSELPDGDKIRVLAGNMKVLKVELDKMTRLLKITEEVNEATVRMEGKVNKCVEDGGETERRIAALEIKVAGLIEELGAGKEVKKK